MVGRCIFTGTQRLQGPHRRHYVPRLWGGYKLPQKTKLQGKSSTKNEIIGVYKSLPQALWWKIFVEDQGYTIKHNIIYQNKKSAILLETNGRWSSSGMTKHVNARYFYIKDNVDQGDVEIQHIPAETLLP